MSSLRRLDGAGERPSHTTRRADADAPRRPRGRGDPHLPRGRSGARAAGAALLRRQGLDRAAAARGEGVSPRQVPVPGHACRHGAQLPRGDRVPRPPRARARRAANRRVGAGVDRQGPRRRADRTARVAQPLADHELLDAIEEHQFDAAIGGARRDEERARAKERIFSFRDDFGQWNPARSGPSSGTSTTPAYGRASTCASSRSRTGRGSTCGSTSRASSSSCPTSIRTRAQGVPPRRDAVRGLRLRRAHGGRGSVHGRRCASEPSATCRARAASSPTPRRSRPSSTRSRRHASPSAGKHVRTTVSPRQRWRTKRGGYF